MARARAGSPVQRSRWSIPVGSASVCCAMGRRGQDAALAAAMTQAFGTAPPGPGRSAAGAGATAIWIQPGAWMLTAPRGEEGALATRAAEAFAGIAAVEDQSHGRVTIAAA